MLASRLKAITMEWSNIVTELDMQMSEFVSIRDAQLDFAFDMSVLGHEVSQNCTILAQRSFSRLSIRIEESRRDKIE